MRRITKLESRPEGSGSTRDRCSARAAARSGLAAVTHRRLHERRQVARCSTASRTRACSSRTGCSPRSTRRRAGSSLPGGEPVLLTDTVGFVRRLPHGLVEAFKSTLEVATEPTSWSTSSTPAPPTRTARSPRCATVLARDRRRPRARAARVQQGRPRARRGQGARRPSTPARSPCSAVTGEGIDEFLLALGDRLRALHRGRRARRARTTAATCSPRSTARARSSRRTRGATVMRVRARLVGRVGRAAGGVRAWRRPADPVRLEPHMASITDRRRLRPAAVPVRPARPAQAARRAARRRAGRPLDRHAVRSAAGSGDRRARRVGRRTRLPAEHRHRSRCASAAQRWIARRFGVDVPRRPDRRVRRHQGVRRRRCRSGCACARRPRHRAVSGGRVPDLRDGRDPRRLPAVPVPLDADGALDLDAIDPADAERALVLWVNSPSNPTGALDDLGAAAAWGRPHDVPVFSDECYVEFTWDGRGAHDPRARPRRCRRRALALEALEPGRRARRLLRRRRRARRTTCRRCASTSG